MIRACGKRWDIHPVPLDSNGPTSLPSQTSSPFRDSSQYREDPGGESGTSSGVTVPRVPRCREPDPPAWQSARAAQSSRARASISAAGGARAGGGVAVFGLPRWSWRWRCAKFPSVSWRSLQVVWKLEAKGEEPSFYEWKLSPRDDMTVFFHFFLLSPPTLPLPLST